MENGIVGYSKGEYDGEYHSRVCIEAVIVRPSRCSVKVSICMHCATFTTLSEA